MRRFYHSVSAVFHPTLILTYLVLVLLNVDTYLKYAINDDYKWFLYLMIFVNTFLFPLLVSLVLLQRKMISSLLLEKREERIIPFGFTLGFYVFTYYLLQKTAVAPLILSIVFGASLVLLIISLMTVWFKVSAHGAGIGGAIGAFLGVYLLFSTEMGPILCLSVLIWAAVANARFRLDAHNGLQWYVGSATGLLGMFFAVYFSLG